MEDIKYRAPKKANKKEPEGSAVGWGGKEKKRGEGKAPKRARAERRSKQFHWLAGTRETSNQRSGASFSVSLPLQFL